MIKMPGRKFDLIPFIIVVEDVMMKGEESGRFEKKRVKGLRKQKKMRRLI